MSPVALHCPLWWLARGMSRVLTGLAVAVALALSGGLLPGDLSPVPTAGSFPATWSVAATHSAVAATHSGSAARPFAGSADRVLPAGLTDGADPRVLPAGLTAPGDGLPSLGAEPAVVRPPAVPGPATIVGLRPVRPLVGAASTPHGSRAPPADR